MRFPDSDTPWHIDVRTAANSAQLSLDLCRLLPRRITVGPVAVVTLRPYVALSVIKKRWRLLIAEVERHYARTLDPFKREALRDELDRLRDCRFSCDPRAIATVYFITPGHAPPVVNSLFLLCPLKSRQFTLCAAQLQPRGLLVLYDNWPAAYEQTLPLLGKLLL